MDIVNQRRLDTANYAVTNELDRLGLYDPAMQAVDTYLVSFGFAYGWQYYGGSGHINIPRISFSRLSDLWSGSYTSLRDVLRHEFGHAIADTHRGLFRSHRFSATFGAPHNWDFGWEYDPNYHVTRYAATAPAEDFAEVFMFYLRHDGRLPARIAAAPIRRKWRFIDELRKAISNGDRRWQHTLA
jgi:hypothetical protein